MQRQESSDSLKFVSSVNALTHATSKKQIAEEKRAQRKEICVRTERERLRRLREKQRALEKARSREHARRVDVARQKLVTKQLFRIQARHNGFDLDNFSYRPDPALTQGLLQVTSDAPLVGFPRKIGSNLEDRSLKPSLSSISIVSLPGPPNQDRDRVEVDYNRK